MSHLPIRAEVEEKDNVFKRGFSPYVNNAGTVCAIAGKNFVVVAGDTRMSNGGYSIQSRNVSKLFSINDRVVLASSGMQADAKALRKNLDYVNTTYKYDHNKELTAPAASQLLSNTLYSRRFFPFYTFNLLCGLDEKNEGYVYGYDAIGSFERIPYGVNGSSSALITSLLDNQVEFKHQKKNKKELSLEETIDLLTDAMNCAGERDIYTGDSLEIWIISESGTQRRTVDLKKD